MKNLLLFILPIIAFSFTVQAQQDELSVTNEPSSITKDFFDAVRVGDINAVIDFIDVDFMNGRGIDVNTPNELGQTALHIAAGNADMDMVEALWARGAKIMTKDNEGNTPLHTLVLEASLRTFDDSNEEYDSLSVAEFLLDKGADSEERNFHISTPLDIAQRMTFFDDDITVNTYDDKENPDESLLGYLSWIDDFGGIKFLPYVIRQDLRRTYLDILALEPNILKYLLDIVTFAQKRSIPDDNNNINAVMREANRI